MKKIKLIILALLSLLGFFLTILLFLGLSVDAFIYWWLFTIAIFLIWNFKLNSKFSFYFASILFVISAILCTAGLVYIGEIVMRVCFLGLMIGLFQSLVEYKHR